MKKEEAIYTLALALMPGVGAITARHLISHCGSATGVFRAGFKELIRITGVGEIVARRILAKEGLSSAEREYERCNREGINLSFYSDPGYPQRLKPLYDAPLVLYSEGDIDFYNRRTVGIVGTRKITEYGRRMTEKIIRELVPFDPLVISGLAYGVDILAHRLCVKNDLSTLGIMASGIDVIYPKVHEKIVCQMKRSGGIMTENPLGTKPDYQRFPARNRIIAGLSDVLIVVESAGKGGSLITAEFARNYHREIFAVPGGLDQGMSEGCNGLIQKHKASIFTSVREMAKEIGWSVGQQVAVQPQYAAMTGVFEGFSLEEGQLIALLRNKGPLQIDELSWHTGIYPGKLAGLLLNLEFQGVVRSFPGKKYAVK